MKNSHLGQAWLVLALAACFGAALAGVEVALKPKIDSNKQNDTIGQIPLLVEGATQGNQEVFGDITAYRATDDNDKLVGWVVLASGQGFADKIELLIGFNSTAERITGLYILDQKETPGLGNKITFSDWREQFKGKSAEYSIEITKSENPGENEVQAVTGATISSESVAGIINAYTSRFRKELKGQTN